MNSAVASNFHLISVHGGCASCLSSTVAPGEDDTTFALGEVAFVSGVNVMGISRMELRSAGRSIEALDRLFGRQRENESVALSAAEVEPHIELSNLQIIALLRMNHSTLCRGVARYVQGDNPKLPSRFDYAVLLAHRLCYKADGDRYHTITTIGSAFAIKIAHAKARELGIHVMIDDGPFGATAKYSCICGGWSNVYQRGQFTHRNALGGWARHAAASQQKAKSA